MKTVKIATIVGARPQFVKAAAVQRAFVHFNQQKPSLQLHNILIHTGQHYDENMSDVFFKEMCIPPPDYHLGIGGCSQGAMTGRMIEEIEKVLLKEKPDWVLVYGDTNSTLAGTLAAVKLHIPVAHVEAGLRSFNRKMPEEINRIVTDQCSQLLFTPSRSASEQLIKEGIESKRICEVGDVMYDVALFYKERAQSQSKLLDSLGLVKKNYVLATIHRAENTDDPQRLKEIFRGLLAIAKETKVVLPLHPRTKHELEKQHLLEEAKAQLCLINPVGYLDMIQLESQAKLILTDSGGVQKEAYFFKTPCLTLRNETEWVELVTHGFNHLVPAKEEEILRMYREGCSDRIDWNKHLYGQGTSSSEIVKTLAKG